MNSKFTPRPQLRPIEIKIIHTNPTQHTQTSQQTHALANPKVNIHTAREHDGAESEERAHEIVAGEEGGGVLRVGKRDIGEYCLEDYED